MSVPALPLVVGICQARLGSTRLPGKVLRPVRVVVAGGTEEEVALVDVQWARMERAETVSQWVLATTTNRVDDALVAWADRRSIACYRGSERDVLQRYFHAALVAVPKAQRATAFVVRCTADCPLVGREEIDYVVHALAAARSAAAAEGASVLPVCASNALASAVRAAPTGLDVEVFTFEALERAAREAHDPYDREHVAPFIRRMPDFVECNGYPVAGLLGARWTVDTVEDHVFVAAVLERVTRNRAGAAGASACESASALAVARAAAAAAPPSAAVLAALDFPSTDVAEVVAAEPELAAINAGRGGAGVAPGAAFECPRGQALHVRAVDAMPGTHRLAHQWPAYYAKAVGCHVSDLDGHRFVDTLCSTCVLGMGDADVNTAVIAAVERGSVSTLNSPDEVALAEKLVALHSSWAGGVKFARTASEAVALAISAARAHTGRDGVAVCGWHARYSCVSATAVTFAFNDISWLETLGQRLAAIVVEPAYGCKPRDGFLAAARKAADSTGAVLIFDEVSTGFRMCVGGAHTVLAEGPLDMAAAGSAGYIEPDIAVFAEGMSNGFAMAAVVCRAGVAGADTEDDACFADSTGFAAALATIEKFERCKVHEHIAAVGKKICDAWVAASAAARLPIFITRDACALPSFAWRGWSNSDAIVMTAPVVRILNALFFRSMLTRGFIAANIWHVTYAHTFAVVDDYQAVVTDVFKTVIAPALADALAAGENEDAAVAAVVKHIRRTNSQDVHSLQT